MRPLSLAVHSLARGPRGWYAFLCAGLLAALLIGLGAQPAPAQDRLKRSTPGLVLETGARTTPCDVLLFTPLGEQLLAAGDDKVIRTWDVSSKTFSSPTPAKIFRWPTVREQLGSIYALAISPDGKRLAIGGCGVHNALVAVLDSETGKILHAMTDLRTSYENTWALAWSLDGKYVIIGDEAGMIHRWEPGESKRAESFVKAGSRYPNRVRVLYPLEGGRCLSVAQDGDVLEWNVNKLDAKPRKLAAFKGKSILRATVSPDLKWLLACDENATGEEDDSGLIYARAEIFDLQKILGPTPPREEHHWTYQIPKRQGWTRIPTALAFSPGGDYLAIGVQERLELAKGELDFYRVLEGRVFVYSLKGGPPVSTHGLPVGYRPYNIAFRPGKGHEDQLATAGGVNDEVRLWNWRKETMLDEIRSPGSSIWSVGFSSDDCSIAMKDQMAAKPAHPNERGAGPWRVFDLKDPRKGIQPADEKFEPIRPLKTVGGWSIETTLNSYLWVVKGPEGKYFLRNKLYSARVNQKPICYTFLPENKKLGKPIRLVIGHTWGASVYDCEPKAFRLSRVLIGHESEVTAVGPSANGKFLLTASRDQTICCFSLVDWDYQAELGASFKIEGGKLRVKQVAVGSPAWECGLSNEDEILALTISERDNTSGIDYGDRELLKEKKVSLEGSKALKDADILERLQNIDPYCEHVFIWKTPAGPKINITTVKQRPLWRFFPTRQEEGSEWVMWRWRDYYYDTSSSRADRLLGWQINSENLEVTPEFLPLDRLGGALSGAGIKRSVTGFHNPNKVWQTISDSFQKPEKLSIPDLIPPQVSYKVTQKPGPDRDLEVEISALPRSDSADQQVTSVVVLLDDTRIEQTIPIAKGKIDSEPLTISRKLLRNGENKVRVICFNAYGARGESSSRISFHDPKRLRPTLYGLCVGINEYPKVAGMPSLRCAVKDAATMTKVFREHADSDLFKRAEIEYLKEEQATARAIVAQLEKMQKEAGPDDWFVLFLSGHGAVRRDPNTRAAVPGSFSYVCYDSEAGKPETMLPAEKLTDLLLKIKGRKLIFIDACHSGGLTSPIRSLNRNGSEFFIFAASKADQSAIEPNPAMFKDLPQMQNGLFTQGLLSALAYPDTAKKRGKPVTAEELALEIQLKMRSSFDIIVKRAGIDLRSKQIPDYFPTHMPPLPILCRP